MRKKTDADILSAKFLRRFAASAFILLAVCLVLMTPVSAALDISSLTWDTTYNSETEFTIETPQDLLNLSIAVSQGKDFYDKYIKLGDDIDLQDVPWTPIGYFINPNLNAPFNGYFEGDGKTIKGLNVTTASWVTAGLFGYIGSGGFVANLTVEGKVDVTGDGSMDVFAGGIAGMNDGGWIAGSSFQGPVKATIQGIFPPSSGSLQQQPLLTAVGGITGDNSGRIMFCYTTGAVTAEGEMAVAGGITGQNFGEVDGCYATGAVTAKGDVAFAGGIVGRTEFPQALMSQVKISNCYALNEAVTGTGSVVASAARVIGYNFGVANSGNSGNPVQLSGNNNHGWKHIEQVISGSSLSVDSTVLATWNAAECCAADIQNSGWSADIWTLTGYGDYKLPVLRISNNHPSETPEHLLVTVTFEENGGSTVDDQTVLDGAMVTEPTGVTKTGYTLDGWFDQGLTDQWVFSTVVHPATMTLYAKWTGTTPVTPQQYTVTFYRNDGSNNEPYHSETVDNGVPVTRPATDPLRDNYAFTGWFTEAQGGTEYDFNTQVIADLNLYANWTSAGIAPGGGEPDDEPANNNNGGGGGGGEGTYDTYPRNTDENGDAGFGKSPVVIRVDLPKGTETAVTLITNPETPETPDTEDTDVYYEFELDIPDYPEETEGDVIWRIPKSLLNDEFGADDYGVYVYDEDEWKPLDSVWEEGDKDYIHYTTGITGDGNFIIVKEKGMSKKAGDDAPVVTPGDEPQDEPGSDVPPSSGDNIPDDKEEKEIPVLGIGIGVLILILIIAGIVIAVRRRK